MSTFAEAPTEHHSLGVERLVRGLELAPGRRILDLGAARGANVEFFGRYGCKLYIADLYRALKEQQPGANATALDRALPDQLPRPERGGFDVVLAWDLLNYFEADEIEVIGRHVGALANPDALLFAMIATHRDMTDKPRNFHVVDASTVHYGALGTAVRPAPRYVEPDLQRMLPDFKVQATYLLRNGMQEYLLYRRAAAAAAE